MSRPVITIMLPEGRHRLRFSFDKDIFLDPHKGYLNTMERDANGAWIKVTRNLSEVYSINGMAATMLRRFGYDLDGLRCSFYMLKFFEDPNPPATICKDLGDEYRFDTEDGLDGTIRRVLPRYSIDKAPFQRLA